MSLLILIYWVAGLIFEWLIDASNSDTKYELSYRSYIALGLRLALGLLAAYGMGKFGLTHWAWFIIVIPAGFLSFHIVDFLKKKKN